MEREKVLQQTIATLNDTNERLQNDIQLNGQTGGTENSQKGD